MHADPGPETLVGGPWVGGCGSALQAHEPLEAGDRVGFTDHGPFLSVLPERRAWVHSPGPSCSAAQFLPPAVQGASHLTRRVPGC